jgi:hypothetical protein
MQPSDFSNLSAEPSAFQGLTAEQKDRLTDILDRYLSALESGVPLPREELLAAHPDLAGTLQTYLASLDELHEVAAGFGDSCPPEAAIAAQDDEKRLGDFRLLREIGRGGMGVVYEAQQISLNRRVALKVLPFAAVLDSRQIARFQHEAQAAAQLDHPHIVPVFAVGVERGVHYYAMQYIDGQPLDRALADVCSSAGNSLLSTKSGSRQEYFRTVVGLAIQAAEALHAAHEHGIVHRDVKPSNLLLDGEGKLWVTDFGLARCQTDANLTRTGDVVGTARYMSPEQALGQTALVDHRTDVYSLGITLYELLALQPAFPGDGGPALLRRIEQEEPRRLRQLQPKLGRDLENVVLKAMAKQRDERYATAQEFADDLRCVLESKPTIARPPTASERLGKLARRHKRMVAATAVAGLLALLGMFASTLLINREKNRAERNYALSQQHFREAQGAVDRLGFVLAERLADVPGAEQVRRGLLQDTLRYYGNFVNEARQNPALRVDLAATYSKIGTLAGEIGSNDEAIAAHENAIQLFRQLAADQPREADYRRRLAVSYNNLALLLQRSGRTDAARQAYDTAIRLQQALVDGAPNVGQYLGDLALSHANLGLLQSETSDMKAADASFQQAIGLQEHLLKLQPDDPEQWRNLAASLNNLGARYVAQQPNRAAELYQQALACQTKAAALRPGELKYQSDVALTYNNLAAAQSRIGQLAAAAAAYGHAIAIRSELVRSAPAKKSYRHDLAVSFNNLGLTQSTLRQPSAAERSYRQALGLQEALVKQNPQDLELRSSLGGIYNNLGMVLEDQRRAAEACQSYAQAVECQTVAQAHAPQVSRYRLFLSKHYYNYGRVLRQLGRPDEAARAALARRELWPADPQHLFAVAEELALATEALAGSPRAGLTAEKCAQSALETLKQALAAGWRPAGNPAWTKSFAALKGYPGFKGLVNN